MGTDKQERHRLKRARRRKARARQEAQMAHSGARHDKRLPAPQNRGLRQAGPDREELQILESLANHIGAKGATPEPKQVSLGFEVPVTQPEGEESR